MAAVCLTATCAFAQDLIPKPPTFLAAPAYSAFATQVAIVDVNGDGLPDIVYDDLNAPQICVQLGTDGSAFRPGPCTTFTLSSRFNTFGVISADLNGDGKPDIIFGTYSNCCVYGPRYLSFGNGDGTFGPATELQPAGLSDQDLIVTDLNGDGNPDLVLDTGNTLFVLLNNGNGTFAAPATITWSYSGGGIVQAGDVNGDGIPDLVATSQSGLVVLLGKGNGTFEVPSLVAMTDPPGFLDLVDMNLDGHLDVVMTLLQTTNIAVMLGDGKGHVGEMRQYPTTIGLTEITTGDLNGDGYPDVLADDGYYEFVILHGEPGGSLSAATEHISAGLEYTPAIANLGAGHRPAAIIPSGQGAIAVVSDLKGTLNDGFNFAGFSSVHPYQFAIGDFNGDSKPDVIYNDQNFDYEGTTSYQVLLGTGNPVKPLEPLAIVNLAQEVSTPVAGDFNGDGKLDVIFFYGAPGVAYLLFLPGNGDGTFASGQAEQLLPAISVESVVVADFNGDGKLDFAANTGTIFFGNGDGTFYVSQQFLLAGDPLLDNQVSLGNFNNDGIPDLLFCAADAVAPITVALGQADGHFSPPVGLQYPQLDPASCAMADFNGDGNLDVVGVDTVGDIGLFFGKGDGTFREPIIYDNAFFADTVGVVSADFNGDGLPDFAVSTSFNTTAFFLGDGGGKFTLGGEIVGAGATLMGHFHGNPAASPPTTPDLVVADEHTNFLSVFINTTK